MCNWTLNYLLWKAQAESGPDFGIRFYIFAYPPLPRRRSEPAPVANAGHDREKLGRRTSLLARNHHTSTTVHRVIDCARRRDEIGQRKASVLDLHCCPHLRRSGLDAWVFSNSSQSSCFLARLSVERERERDRSHRTAWSAKQHPVFGNCRSQFPRAGRKKGA